MALTSSFDLTPGQTDAIMLLGLGMLAKYYFGRILGILERVPPESWFASVDAAMHAMGQLDTRLIAFDASQKDIIDRLKGYSERVRDLEVAQATQAATCAVALKQGVHHVSRHDPDETRELEK